MVCDLMYAVMRRAQSMAHAALRCPAMLSSWSWIGPRRRANAIQSSEQVSSSETPPAEAGASEPFIAPCESTVETVELNVCSSEGAEWNSEFSGCYSDVKTIYHDLDQLDVAVAKGEELVERHGCVDRVTEVELWHQLQHELYDRAEDKEANVEKEIRKEEAAAMEEVGATQAGGPAPQIINYEVHRFYPPGKTMHIISLHAKDNDDDAHSASFSDSEKGEDKVGIFPTSRAFYGKLRLSHSMISGHFMPACKRQIEKLIKQLEKEASDASHSSEGTGVVL